MRDLNVFSGLLSDLSINGDKDWTNKNITNISALYSSYMYPRVATAGGTLNLLGFEGVAGVIVARVINAATATFDIAQGKLTGALNANSQNITAINEITFAKVMGVINFNSQALNNIAHIAGNSLLAEHDAEVSTSGTVYGILKAYTVKIAGGLRVKFNLRTSDSAATAYGRIYKNGSPFGTEQSTVSESYVTKSEDLSGIVAGDVLSLQVKISDGAKVVYVQNYRLYCDSVLNLAPITT